VKFNFEGKDYNIDVGKVFQRKKREGIDFVDAYSTFLNEDEISGKTATMKVLLVYNYIIDQVCVDICLEDDDYTIIREKDLILSTEERKQIVKNLKIV